MVRLAVRVIPKAGASEVAGLRDEELLVRVTAAPEAGKANSSTCGVVAEFFGVAPSSVSVCRGHASRHKILDVKGVTEEVLVARLEVARSMR